MVPNTNNNAFGSRASGSGIAPRNCSAPKSSANSGSAPRTNSNPMHPRSRRVVPWTISAPHPGQTLARSDTRVSQCGQTKLLTRHSNTGEQNAGVNRYSTRVCDSDPGDCSVFAGLEPLVTLRHGPHPLNSELLQCEHERAEVVTKNLHIV